MKQAASLAHVIPEGRICASRVTSISCMQISPLGSWLYHFQLTNVPYRGNSLTHSSPLASRREDPEGQARAGCCHRLQRSEPLALKGAGYEAGRRQDAAWLVVSISLSSGTLTGKRGRASSPRWAPFSSACNVTLLRPECECSF